MIKYIQNTISKFTFKNNIPEGKDFKGIRLQKQRLSEKDLSETDMQNCTARKVDFSRADMRGICMKDSDLRNSDFSGADLSGADMRRTDLRGAKFDNAILDHTKLAESDIRGASFKGALMHDTDLSYVFTNKNTVFETAGLEGAFGYLRSSWTQAWLTAEALAFATLLSSVYTYVAEGESFLVYMFIGISAIALMLSILAIELGDKDTSKKNAILSEENGSDKM